MQESKHTKGGAREGAGRPLSDDPKKNRSIRATDQQWETFKAQGGNAWFSALLDSLKKIGSKKP
jgi:hypothetical protein